MASPKRKKTSSRPAKSSSVARPRTQVVPVEPGLRLRVAEFSKGPMLLLSRQPKFVVPGVMLILVLVGLAGPSLAAIPALALLLLFLVWLTYLSWPIISTSGRGMRLLADALVIVLLVGRISR